MTDVRTPGWTTEDTSRCGNWTADQHAAVAAELLDSNMVPTVSEDAWNGEPPHRCYTVIDPDARRGEDPDYAPYLAALVHSQLAIYKSGASS